MRSLREIGAKIEIIALLAWLALSATAFGFLALASEMREGELTSFDKTILWSLRKPHLPHAAIGPSWLHESLRDITALGGVTLIALFTLLAVLVLWWHGRRRQAGVLAFIIPLAYFSSELFKLLYARPRPDFVVARMDATSNSFPSGHTTVSTAAYLTLAVVFASLEASQRRAVIIFVAAIVLCVLVGLSRIYLGVHWPSDVIAGWMLGGCWALAAARFAVPQPERK